jgi:amidase
VSGLPVGLSFIGPRWSEQRLIGLAYAFEQAIGARLIPALRATCPPPAPIGPAWVRR